MDLWVSFHMLTVFILLICIYIYIYCIHLILHINRIYVGVFNNDIDITHIFFQITCYFPDDMSFTITFPLNHITFLVIFFCLSYVLIMLCQFFFFQVGLCIWFSTYRVNLIEVRFDKEVGISFQKTKKDKEMGSKIW